jgi:hypothetical protein
MGQLREDVAEVRRGWREVRASERAKLDATGAWRPHWWHRVMVCAGAVLGIFLLLQGDTVERIIGIGLLAPSAVLTGFTAWVYWKALRLLRESRRAQ